MREVFAALPGAWQEAVLLQGTASRREILSEHRRRVDVGISSTIFGLASFAEGIDLPGSYCEHVVIAKIPFAVPTTPVEEARSEWLRACKRNYFMEIALPQASLKLIQAVGRLVRTVDDVGTVTILDNRLVRARYGALLLKALPPFERRLGV